MKSMTVRCHGQRILAILLSIALLFGTAAMSFTAAAATQTLRFENAVLATKYAASGTPDNGVTSASSAKLATDGSNTFMEFSFASAPTFMTGFRIKAEDTGNNLTFTENEYYLVDVKHKARAIAEGATVELRLYWGSCKWGDGGLMNSKSETRDYITLVTYTAATADWDNVGALVQFANTGVADYFGNGIHLAVKVISGPSADNVIWVDDVSLTKVDPASVVTLTLNPNIGTLDKTTVLGVVGDEITLPVPTATVAFEGWKDAAGDPLTDANPTKDGFQYVLSTTTTITATYAAAGVVVTLDANDGALADTTASLAGLVDSLITWPTDPTRSGFEFTGWVKADGTAFGDVYPGMDMVAYASWKPTASYTTDANVQTFEETDLALSDFYSQKFVGLTDFTNHTVGGDVSLKGHIGKNDHSQRGRLRLVLKTGDATTAENHKVEAGGKYVITYYVKPARDTETFTGYVAVISDPATNIGKTENPGGNDCHKLQDNVVWSVNGGDTVTAKEIKDVALNGGEWNKIIAVVPTATLHNDQVDNYLSIGFTDSKANWASYAPYDVYVDDITVTKVAAGNYGATMDLESMFDQLGTDLSIRGMGEHTAKVTMSDNHTEGGMLSLYIKDTVKDNGNERAQIILKDGNGQKLSLVAGKQYKLTLWVKLDKAGTLPGAENGFRYWLVPSKNGEMITDSSLEGVKNQYKVYETSETVPLEGVVGQWKRYVSVFTAENAAGDVSGDLLLGISTFSSVGAFWLDDILLEEYVPAVVDPTNSTQTFETYDVGANDFSLHQNNRVSDLYNHGDGAGKSLEINNVDWTGSNRNQIRLLDPGTGLPLKVQKNVDYLLSFWVYLPEENLVPICMNVWAASTNDSSRRITDKNAANCEWDDGSSGLGTPIPVGQWTKVTRHFRPVNGDEVILGLANSYLSVDDVKYYIDDLSLGYATACTVTLDSNGPEKENEVLEHFKETPLTNLPEPFWVGYEFAGWCWDAEGKYPFLNNTNVSEDITLYAAWVENPNYSPDSNDKPVNKEPEYETIEVWNRVPKDPDEIVYPVLDAGETLVVDDPIAVPDRQPQTPSPADPAEEGLHTWAILLIVVAAVVVVGSGALIAALLIKKKASVK